MVNFHPRYIEALIETDTPHYGKLNPHGILTPSFLIKRYAGSQNTMDRGVKISWIEGRYTMGRSFDIPCLGGKNTMGKGFDIQWVGRAIYHGKGGQNNRHKVVKIQWVRGSIYHG